MTNILTIIAAYNAGKVASDFSCSFPMFIDHEDSGKDRLCHEKELLGLFVLASLGREPMQQEDRVKIIQIDRQKSNNVLARHLFIPHVW